MERRDFLKTTLSGVAVLAASGLPWGRRTLAGTVAVGLTAEAYTRNLVDGATVTAWRFRDPSNGGPGGLSSGLVVLAGDPVEVTVTNNLDRPINFAVPGALTGTVTVAPTASHLYSFTAPAAGSYYFTDETNGEISRAMGLAGPLVVMPADGSSRLYPGGPFFDRQYTVFMQEHDDRLNAAIAGGGSYDMADYEPNYFFLNGLSFPDTRADADTLIVMSTGEDVAIRLINPGIIATPMHFHGYHVDVVTRDRTPEAVVIEKDTVLVRPSECVDVILDVNQAGMFPMHTHYVPGTTANGVYVNPYGGALTMLHAT